MRQEKRKFIHHNLGPVRCNCLVVFSCCCKHALFTVMQASLSHMEKYQSIDGCPLLLNRKREKLQVVGLLIFKRFRWIPAPALHTEEKTRISQRTWPADPVASTLPSIPQHPLPTHPPHLSTQPCLLQKACSAPKHFAFMPYSFSIT